MKLSVKQIYTSVACNRIPEVVDWNNEGLICFGAKNAVVIYDTNIKGADPFTVLTHHRSVVNSVKWVRKSDGTCTELVSCSADKTAAVWTLENGYWKVSNSLAGHTDGVTCVFGIYNEGNDLTVYTGSIDSTVRIWKRQNGVLTHQHTISLNGGLCLTLHGHQLPGAGSVLFCALDDHKIHVFAGNDYARVHTLVGHEDWVRGLDVLDVDSDTILLASASQDTYIRIWRLSRSASEPAPASVLSLNVETREFIAGGARWAARLDAVLAAHEGWVYGVQWQPRYQSNTKPVFRLLSSSIDKTIIIWEPDCAGAGDGVWTERVRVGEVGGNGLGFYGSKFGPNGTSFMGHGYNGSFHVWTLDKSSNQWQPDVVCGGHFAAAEDVCWEPQGRYIISAGADQTTRAHAPWRRRDGAGTEWHEIARPQVHGHEVCALAPLSPTEYAAAADEKVIRVFTAPRNFADNFENIVGEPLGGDTIGGPEGASVPSLGLSNKAVFVGDEADLDDDNDGYFVPIELTAPPTEETLQQNTLWPERRKLYGHGHAVRALSAAPDNSRLASAGQATDREQAAVLLWDTKTWEQTQKLESHTLTVTQLAFSPDERYLLSVSRDRRWSLFERQQDSKYELVAATDKSNGIHTRIIWCCAWAHDGDMFATGSRDGKVCVWTKTEINTDTSLKNYALYGKLLELPSTSVTALAFAPTLLHGSRIVATGFESGVIRLYAFDGTWSLLHEMDTRSAHHLTVRRLQFRPQTKGRELALASCGADHFVRIHSIVLS